MGNNLKIPSETAKQVIQDSCQQRSKGMLANYANELSGKWLEILKKSSCQKLVCKKSSFCKIQGMSEVSKVHAACYPARVNKYYVEGVWRNKIIINTVINKYLRLHLRLLFVMSEVSKALYTQMNRMKPQILQWLPYYLIWSRSHCNSNFNSKWVVVRRNNPK